MAKKFELHERTTNEVVYPISLAECILKENGESIKNNLVPDGGESGQVLSKTENGVEWGDASVELPDNLVTFNDIATTKKDGIISKEDKEKLDSLHNVTWRIFEEIDNPILDVVLYNNTTGQKEVVSNLDNIDASNYTPIGIVVIPASHNVYGTGECGVCSLAYMDCLTPDTGTTNISSAGINPYYCSNGSQAVSELNEPAILGRRDNPPLEYVSELYSGKGAYIPSDIWNKGDEVRCPHDLHTKWYGNNENERGYCPSPYLTDGSRNPLYYSTQLDTSTKKNILNDFNGKEYTSKTLELATAQSDWKTADTIINNPPDNNTTNTGYFPTVCCSWRYHTKGTNQGDWYIPSAAEIGYLGARFKKFVITVNKINDIFNPDTAAGIIENNNFWCSNLIFNNGRKTMRISTMNGALAYVNVNAATNTARAFYRLKI